MTLADPPLERLVLGGTEEEAIEEQLEDATVLLGLGDGRGQRFAEVVLLLPGHGPKRRERVQDLRRADREALASQLVAERERRQAPLEEARLVVARDDRRHRGLHAATIDSGGDS